MNVKRKTNFTAVTGDVVRRRKVEGNVRPIVPWGPTDYSIPLIYTTIYQINKCNDITFWVI